jgi:hypothetical protein
MIDDDDEIVKALRRALPPRGETAPRRDLWPEVARKISAPRAATARGGWVLAAAAALWLLIFPQGIAALLYLL